MGVSKSGPILGPLILGLPKTEENDQTIHASGHVIVAYLYSCWEHELVSLQGADNSGPHIFDLWPKGGTDRDYQ